MVPARLSVVAPRSAIELLDIGSYGDAPAPMRPRVQVSTNEDPMTRLKLRPDAMDRLADKANRSFRLPAQLSGNRQENDRIHQQG
jgi:hypothetical protein